MSALQILVALDGEVDRGLIETVVTRDPKWRCSTTSSSTVPPASGLGPGDALVVAVADYTAEARDFVVKARRQHGPRPIVLMCPTGARRLPARGVLQRRRRHRRPHPRRQLGL